MKEMKRILSLVLCFVMLVGLMPNLAFAAEGTPVVVVSGSDYQASTSGTTMANIAKKINASPFGILMGGDYDAGTMYPNASHLTDVDNAITSAFPSVAAANRIMIQGNHETYGDLRPDNNELLDDTGAHDTAHYGVYAINYEDFDSASSGLKNYLDGKTGYTKPIFVITHQPLHATNRSGTKDATAIFNVLNAAGAKGLNIIFLFGHNHSGSYDDYLGGGAIYLKKGDSMRVYGGSSAQTLNFTYMNCGYVGYSYSGADNGLTMTAFEIYEDEVIIKRYDANGLHNLKSKGVATSGYAADTNVYGSAVLSLDDGTSAIKTLAETEGGSGSGNDNTEPETPTTPEDPDVPSGGDGYTYELVTSIEAGEKYVIVGNDDAVALMDNNGSFGNQNVTISGTTLTSEVALTEWTISGTSGGTIVSDQGNGLSYSNSSFNLTGAADNTFDIAAGNNNNFSVHTVRANSSYNSYYFNYDGSGWTSKPTSIDYVRLYKLTGTGSGGGSETPDTPTTPDAPPSVDTDNKGWITISDGKGKAIYELDKDGVNAGQNYLIVNTGTDGEAFALTNDSGSVGKTAVTISGSKIVVDDTNLAWTFTSSSSSYVINNGDTYIHPTRNGGLLGDSESVTVAANGTNTGRYNLTRKSSYGNTTYYVTYSNNAFTTVEFSSNNGVYLFRKTGTEVGTPEYAKLSDNLTATVARGTDRAAAEVAIKAAVDVLVAHTADYSDAAAIPDADENITWTLASNYNGNVPGEYAVTISYKGVELGTAKVIVPDTAILCDDVVYYLEGQGPWTTPIGAAVTEGTPEGQYTYEILEGGDAIIESIAADGTITFTGTEGTAQVKITYTYGEGENASTLEKIINVTASEPHFTLNLHAQAKDENGNPVAGAEITAPVPVKGVEEGDTYSLWAVIKKFDAENPNGADIGDVADNMINWESSDTNIATVDPATGVVTFTGKDGTVTITATYQDGNHPYDTVVFSATKEQYNVPADGTTDFPEYPNEGAIRFDKTATAVGNFSETGIAQVELSMTGVPYTTGSEIDVVLMLDRSRSMSEERINATVAATEAFIKGIVKNEDGSYNGNRIYVGYFMGAATYDITDADNIGGTFTTVDSNEELNELIKNLKAEYTKQSGNGGTDWQIALEDSEKLLDAAKKDGIGNNRPQFCVFMSDGAPSDYVGLDGNSYDHTTAYGTSSDWVTNGSRNNEYEYETYSTRMKGTKGITIYSVLLGETGTQPQFLMNDLSGAAGETRNDTGSAMSKLDKYYYNVPDTDAAADMEKVFSGIAVSILQAATDVVVEDKITKEYTMIFDIPQGDKKITVTNDFYIEFLKYTLDEDHERTDDVVSVTKMYLKNTDGIYSAASNSTGADYAAPVFAQNVIGEKGTMFYWTTDSSYASKAAVSYSDGTNTYYFIPYGMEKNEDGTAPDGWYNMTSGGYANGTVDGTNMSQNLVIATPYFVYNASTKMIYWTVDKLDTAEYALRYFLYLDNSATEVGTSKEADPGSYPTNDHAYITYTNFKGNDCRQEFPKPQLTWSGAQVSYVFYLVNAQGQPINKSGQVVDFANATFVTDVYTEDTVWNKGEDGKITADSKLGIDWLAKELLPSDYKVYDEEAQYLLHVYGNHDNTSNFDYFTIGGADAAAISSSLNSRLEGMNTTASNVSLTTTKVYNTKAGQKIIGYGTYTSEEASNITGETILSGFDFYNTTVAFAVVWQPALAPDTIVVDYGLDVLINVTFNDLMQDNTISGIGRGRDAYGNIVENTGISADKVLGTAPLTTDDGSTISIEPVTEGKPTQIRFSQNDMTFNAPVTFYYESEVNYYEDSEQKTGYLHTSVTVIPATTIYYEDEYVELTTHTRQEDGSYEKSEGWTVNSTDATATQAQDRPGTTQITGVIDANNNYGYDAAYSSMSTYSMSNAAMITVSDGIEGQANFDFYGTGFDVISLTDTTTGTIAVRVYEYNEDGSLASKPLHSYVVDTYYGYMLDENGKWVATDSNNPNALYQVPVMKISGLEYGKYRARIVVFYDEFFDNVGDDSSYDFYLDAIRIYDPTGNRNDVANDAYVKDGEGWPTYEEVRNYVIDQSTEENLGDEAMEGIVFIDGNEANMAVSDYTSFGPNNELYLAPGQAVAFDLNATAAAGKVAKVQMALKTVTGTASVKVYATDGTTALDTDIATATDMYYDITKLNGKTVVIMNDGESGVLSITNVKVTYTEAQPEASDPAPALFMLRRSSVDDALATLNVEEEVPETTVPETTVPEESEPETTVPEETEPETSVPEDTEPETTVPEETEPETSVPEETEPEETKPSQQEQAEQIIRKVVKIIKGFFGWLFG